MLDAIELSQDCSENSASVLCTQPLYCTNVNFTAAGFYCPVKNIMRRFSFSIYHRQ